MWTWLLVTPNVAAMRRDSSNNISIMEEAFADAHCRCLPPGRSWAIGLTRVGFLKPPESDRQWKVRLHGAFSILRDVLGLRPNDQSCHHEAWLHLDFVGRHFATPA